MRIYDTHCHLADEAFLEDLPQVIERLHDAGVCRMNVIADPCEDEPNHERVRNIVMANDDMVWSIGVHPHNARNWSDAAEDTLRKYLAEDRCHILGEIGLDYHYDLSPREKQREVFARQLEMAAELKLPVQLHIREAHPDALDILSSFVKRGDMPAGILHCCTAQPDEAKGYLDAGLYVSFSGAVTFKNAAYLRETALLVPADRVLVETDCPYMAPVPLRGRRNEPAYITHTLSVLGTVRGEAPEPFAEQVWENSMRIVG